MDNKKKLRQVFKLEINNKSYYVKRLFKKRFRYLFNFNSFKKLFKGGIRSFRTLKKLEAIGISVAKPIFAVVYRRGTFIFDSLLVTEEVKSISIYNYLRQTEKITFQMRKEMILKLAKFWAKLFNNSFLFKDAHLDNFLLNFKEGSFNIVLVDVDAISFNPKFLPSSRIEIKTLARFGASVIEALVDTGIPMINKREIATFYQEFFNRYYRKVDPKEYLAKVNKAIIEKLIDRDKRDLINKAEFLDYQNQI
ncbi:lipopolysaccharide kinase InaA family protein [Fuchsiella alkaliacetigena]|uniref:lipopolysaccharide kinase InaA family protein n=1 Tax=Fuchsiella alkaliacetigena TaxID=957042 RepID=UPI00200B0806|nr:lipopolysaccharide kinase InaA family protein [Fuchsiella alkaliacetigena]MCK8824298.1 hypothetical protein [Fuchsiella alkaliacetigena]